MLFNLPNLETWIRVLEYVTSPSNHWAKVRLWKENPAISLGKDWWSYSWDLLPGETDRIKRMTRPTVSSIAAGGPQLWVQLALDSKPKNRRWVKNRIPEGWKLDTHQFWVGSNAINGKVETMDHDIGYTGIVQTPPPSEPMTNEERRMQAVLFPND